MGTRTKVNAGQASRAGLDNDQTENSANPTWVTRRNVLKAIGSTATLLGVAAAAAPHARAQSTSGWSFACASWIHGVSLQIEDQSRIAALSRRAFQAALRTYGRTWIHFAIPTPVIFNGARLRLQRVMLLWGTNVVSYTRPPQPIGARIWAVHVWDGANKLAEFGEVPFIGQFDSPMNPFDIPGAPYVSWGIVVSVLIEADQEILFKSAGGDFWTYTGSQTA
jgi:hypothetical protein